MKPNSWPRAPTPELRKDVTPDMLLKSRFGLKMSLLLALACTGIMKSVHLAARVSNGEALTVAAQARSTAFATVGSCMFACF
jgi:hypothetical protein